MTQNIPFFDGHNDFLLCLASAPDARNDIWLGDTGQGHLDLKRMKASGFAGGLFAIFVPPTVNGPRPSLKDAMSNPPYDIPLPELMTHTQAQPVALTMAGLLYWMQRSAPDDFAVCRSTSEIKEAMARGIIAGVMHMEGAEAIGPDLDALFLFYELGLRSLGPVWSRPTIFGHGVPMKFPGSPDIGSGLTERGKDLIRLCNELGVMIDLSHMNEAGFNDVAAISDRPLVATHSNAHALSASPRNLTDRQLAQIRERNGMVGFNFATFYIREDGRSSSDMNWDPMLRQIDYLVAHLGEDGVGLGSDFDGCIVPDVIGDVTGVPSLLSELKAHGFGAELIAKLAQENWLNCLARCI